MEKAERKKRDCQSRCSGIVNPAVIFPGLDYLAGLTFLCGNLSLSREKTESSWFLFHLSVHSNVFDEWRPLTIILYFLWTATLLLAARGHYFLHWQKRCHLISIYVMQNAYEQLNHTLKSSTSKSRAYFLSSYFYSI